MIYQALTEDQIETRVEKAIDRLDRQLMTNKISQEEYDREVFTVDKWASQQYEYAKQMGVA